MRCRLMLLAVAIVAVLTLSGWHYTIAVAGVQVADFTALRLLLGCEVAVLAVIGAGIWRALEWAR